MYSLHQKTPIRKGIVGKSFRLTPLEIARKTNLASSLKLCSGESNPSVFIRDG